MREKSPYRTYIEKMESIKDPYFKNVNKDLFNGQNSYLRMRMKGSSVFNDEWIKTIEDCIYELGQIVNNPLEVTKTEGALTPIELAKKINYESIQHLASHSQYIKDIDEEGNVIPAKILAQFHKEELHTYENRFIATFIRRLVMFVEKRYDFIKSTVNFDTKDVMYIKNRSMVDGQEVTIETKVTLKKANEDAQSKIGREFVTRVENMRRYVNYFYNSPFMKELKTEKNVRKPILQTNIIRKNPYYHKCYETFLFIEKFSSLGVEYTLDQRYQDFSEKERKALNYILASNLLSLEATERSKTYKSSTKTYKPKLLSSIDDEMFTYGNLVHGPVEYVRVDDKYTEYLKSKISPLIPKKPNKVEKEYFKEEIELQKNTKKHISEVDQLLKRVKREIAKWEKVVIKLIEQRNIAEAKQVEAQLAALRKEEHNILERKRKEIIAAAHEEKAEIKEKQLEEIRIQQEKEKAAQEAIRKEIEASVARALEEVRLAEEAKAAEEAAKKAAEEEAKKAAEEEARRAEEEARAAEEARIAEELAKKEAEEEAARRAAEEAKAAEEAAKAEIEAAKLVEEQTKVEEASVAEEQPVEEVKEEEKAEELAPVEEPTPAPEPQPEPQTEEEQPQEEAVVEQAEKVEEPVVEETPVVEEVKVEEPKQEEKPQEKPEVKKTTKKPSQKKKSSEKTGEIERPKAKKPAKKTAQKKVSKPKEEVKQPVIEEVPTPKVEKIPGRFIVKSNKGYVVSSSEFSNNKSEARIFDDFNDARRYKNMFGGKVIKL